MLRACKLTRNFLLASPPGILDAGGRNATVGLRSRSGYFRRTSVVGLSLFTYYW